MDPKIYSAAKTFSARTFDPKILLRAQPGRVDPWARQCVSPAPPIPQTLADGEDV